MQERQERQEGLKTDIDNRAWASKETRHSEGCEYKKVVFQFRMFWRAF
jgi:hypothetical protein